MSHFGIKRIQKPGLCYYHNNQNHTKWYKQGQNCFKETHLAGIRSFCGGGELCWTTTSIVLGLNNNNMTFMQVSWKRRMILSNCLFYMTFQSIDLYEESLKQDQMNMLNKLLYFTPKSPSVPVVYLSTQTSKSSITLAIRTSSLNAISTSKIKQAKQMPQETQDQWLSQNLGFNRNSLPCFARL